MIERWRWLPLLAFAAACASPTSDRGPASPPPLDASGCFRTWTDGRLIPEAQKVAAPEYPQRAYDEEISGWVLVEASIGPDGHVADPVVVKSQPPGVFEASAIAAFRQFEYCPPAPQLPYPDRFQALLEFKRWP